MVSVLAGTDVEAAVVETKAVSPSRAPIFTLVLVSVSAAADAATGAVLP